ncbi:unnamed protein product, partial [Sphenostylis stenocarpa]
GIKREGICSVGPNGVDGNEEEFGKDIEDGVKSENPESPVVELLRSFTVFFWNDNHNNNSSINE